MMPPPTEYPLQWPSTVEPTKWRESKDYKYRHRTFTKTRADILTKLANMKVLNRPEYGQAVVISCNIQVGADGTPLPGQTTFQDRPGVAVYFTEPVNGKTCVVACDRWPRVEQNMTAVLRTLDGLHSISKGMPQATRLAAFNVFEYDPKRSWQNTTWSQFERERQRNEDDRHRREKEAQYRRMFGDFGAGTVPGWFFTKEDLFGRRPEDKPTPPPEPKPKPPPPPKSSRSRPVILRSLSPPRLGARPDRSS